MSGPWQKFNNPAQGQQSGPWQKFDGAGGNNAEAGNPPPPTSTEQPGVMERAMNWFTKPHWSADKLMDNFGETSNQLIPKFARDPVPLSKRIHDVADTPPTIAESEHPIRTGVEKGLAHAVSDTAGVVSSSTSPAGITAIATGGAGRLPGAIGKIAKVANVAQATGYGGHGLVDMFDDKADESQPDALQRKLTDASMVAGSAAGAAHATKGAAPDLAHKMMNWKMDVPQDALKFTNPGEAVVKEGIYGNSKKGLLDQVRSSQDRIGPQIDLTHQAADQHGIHFDTRPAFHPVDETIANAAKEQEVGTHNKALGFLKEKTNQMGIDPVSGEAQVTDVPRNMDMKPTEANTLKRGVGRTRWAATEPGSATLEAGRRQTYGNLKEQIHKEVPEVAPLDERYSGLTEAENALEPAAREGMKLQLPNASDYMVGGTAAAAAGLMEHNPMTWAKAALGGMALKKVIGSTPVVSRAAYWLGNQEPVQGMTPGPNQPPAPTPTGPVPPPQLQGNFGGSPLGPSVDHNAPSTTPFTTRPRGAGTDVTRMPLPSTPDASLSGKVTQMPEPLSDGGWRTGHVPQGGATLKAQADSIYYKLEQEIEKDPYYQPTPEEAAILEADAAAFAGDGPPQQGGGKVLNMPSAKPPLDEQLKQALMADKEGTDHYAQAKAELGPKATVSQIALRAQELKLAAKNPKGSK